MKTVLKANIDQYNTLNGYQNGIQKLDFAIDKNNNYIITLDILTNPYFIEIRNQLNELERIEYIPYE
jgi:hypothetical protein